MTFEDVERGRIALPPAEIEALRALLDAAGRPPTALGIDSIGGSSVATLDGRAYELTLVGWDELDTLAPLAALGGLRRLHVEGGRFEDLTGVGGPALEQLVVQRSALRTLSGLAPSPRLADILITGSQLTSLGGIGELPALRSLVLERNRIESVEGLAGRSTLESLDLSDNRLESVEGIADLPSLTRLELARNRLETLAGLAELPRLETVLAEENELRDASALDAFPTIARANLSRNQLERFPVLVSRLEPHWWSENPGSLARLAGDHEAARAKRLASSLAAELPEAPLLAGTFSRGSCTWRGSRVHCDVTIPRLAEGARKVVVHRFDLSAVHDLGVRMLERPRRSPSGVVLRLEVAGGRARAYLGRDARVIAGSSPGPDGRPQIEIGHPWVEASPGDPKVLVGHLLVDGTAVWFVIEAVGGEAAGVRYVLEPGYTY
jgi:hypothetical protein